MTLHSRVHFAVEPLTPAKVPRNERCIFVSSEIATTRACIELEVQVLGMLALPTTKASHAIIRNQYRRVDVHSEKLEHLVGKTETDAFLYKTYSQFV